MRSTSTLTISLPPAMAQELEKVRKAEHRTRSELIREALRLYFTRRFPVVTPTAAELRGHRRGQAEIARGDYLTYEQLLHALAASRRPTSRKKLRRLTPKDQRLIGAAVDKLREDPWTCALEELHGQLSGYRLRAGNWRLLCALYPDPLRVDVTDLQRRTTTTYRKRH